MKEDLKVEESQWNLLAYYPDDATPEMIYLGENLYRYFVKYNGVDYIDFGIPATGNPVERISDNRNKDEKKLYILIALMASCGEASYDIAYYGIEVDRSEIEKKGD